MKPGEMMSTQRSVLSSLAFAVAVVALLPGGVRAQDGELALEAYLDMETVSDPQISPDGSRIVYTRRWVDKVNDRSES